eukprot:847394-Rhodomonas_salina.1
MLGRRKSLVSGGGLDRAGRSTSRRCYVRLICLIETCMVRARECAEQRGVRTEATTSRRVLGLIHGSAYRGCNSTRRRLRDRA